MRTRFTLLSLVFGIACSHGTEIASSEAQLVIPEAISARYPAPIGISNGATLILADGDRVNATGPIGGRAPNELTVEVRFEEASGRISADLAGNCEVVPLASPPLRTAFRITANYSNEDGYTGCEVVFENGSQQASLLVGHNVNDNAPPPVVSDVPRGPMLGEYRLVSGAEIFVAEASAITVQGLDEFSSPEFMYVRIARPNATLQSIDGYLAQCDAKIVAQGTDYTRYRLDATYEDESGYTGCTFAFATNDFTASVEMMLFR